MDCSLPVSSVRGISRQAYWSGFPFLTPGDLQPGPSGSAVKNQPAMQETCRRHKFDPWVSQLYYNTGMGKPFPSPEDLPNPGVEPRSPTLQVDSLPTEQLGKPKNTGVGSLSLLQQIFLTQVLTGVSCITGGFFTNWAIREAATI